MSIHDTYEKEGAARRYVMNEMTAQEQSAFEAHYFDCLRCGDEVVDWTRFVESGRAAAKITPFRRRSGLMTWMPSAAAAALVVVVGYQQVAMQGLRMAASRMEVAYHAETPVQGVARSGASEVETVPARRSVVFDVEIAGSSAYRSFRAEVRKGDRVEQSMEFSPAEVKDDTFEVLVRPLPAGSYTLAIEGVKRDGTRGPVAAKSFRVQ